MAQLSQDVYDTATGKFKLFPQGSRLVGTYSSEVAYMVKRVS
jgi:type IV secretion system protein VirB10